MVRFLLTTCLLELTPLYQIQRQFRHSACSTTIEEGKAIRRRLANRTHPRYGWSVLPTNATAISFESDGDKGAENYPLRPEVQEATENARGRTPSAVIPVIVTRPYYMPRNARLTILVITWMLFMPIFSSVLRRWAVLSRSHWPRQHQAMTVSRQPHGSRRPLFIRQINS